MAASRAGRAGRGIRRGAPSQLVCEIPDRRLARPLGEHPPEPGQLACALESGRREAHQPLRALDVGRARQTRLGSAARRREIDDQPNDESDAQQKEHRSVLSASCEGTVYSVVAIKSALERSPARDTESSVNKLPRILVIGALSGPGAEGGTAGFHILQPRFGGRTAAPAGSCAASLSVRLNPLWQRPSNRAR